jgi:hypothetical protein
MTDKSRATPEEFVKLTPAEQKAELVAINKYFEFLRQRYVILKKDNAEKKREIAALKKEIKKAKSPPRKPEKRLKIFRD